jgi:DNA-binding transcriptional ArsR family regulator
MAEIIGPSRTVTVTFSLEPAYNVIGSLSLLDMAEDLSGLGDWVYQTVETSTPEQLRTNQVVLPDSIAHLADASWPSFTEWVDDLAAQDATAMRDRALQARLAHIRKAVGGAVPDPSDLLGDRARFLSLMEDVFRQKGRAFDRSIWEMVHSLLNDPPVMKNTIVTHLRTMWNEGMASEWERNLPMLEDSIAAFESLDHDGLTAVEALGRVALRAQIPEPARSWLEQIEHFIFIPSAHTGPYILHLGGLTDTTARILFGARIPDGVSVRPPTLTRSELLMRLNALADDTRLRILELLARKCEMGTPDIIAQLAVSQSSASRHLEHLTATGYLTARRQRGTNLYRLNRDRIDYTFKALKEFCQ